MEITDVNILACFLCLFPMHTHMLEPACDYLSMILPLSQPAAEATPTPGGPAPIPQNQNLHLPREFCV